MESINNLINFINPNVYMASIDLKDAFFSGPIHNVHQKYLKLMFGQMAMDLLLEYLLNYQKYLLDI